VPDAFQGIAVVDDVFPVVPLPQAVLVSRPSLGFHGVPVLESREVDSAATQMNHPDEGGDAVKTKRLVDAELDLVGQPLRGSLRTSARAQKTGYSANGSADADSGFGGRKSIFFGFVFKFPPILADQERETFLDTRGMSRRMKPPPASSRPARTPSSGVRWSRIAAIRKEIARGAYETPEKWEKALGSLLEAIRERRR